MNELHKEAIKTIKTIIDREKQYRKINNQITELQGDFPALLTCIDSDCSSKIVDLLDKILGDEGLASYFIYECDGTGGSITVDGKEYKLKTIKDLEKYVEEQLQ